MEVGAAEPGVELPTQLAMCGVPAAARARAGAAEAAGERLLAPEALAAAVRQASIVELEAAAARAAVAECMRLTGTMSRCAPLQEEVPCEEAEDTRWWVRAGVAAAVTLASGGTDSMAIATVMAGVEERGGRKGCHREGAVKAGRHAQGAVPPQRGWAGEGGQPGQLQRL